MHKNHVLSFKMIICVSCTTNASFCMLTWCYMFAHPRLPFFIFRLGTRLSIGKILYWALESTNTVLSSNCTPFFTKIIRPHLAMRTVVNESVLKMVGVYQSKLFRNGIQSLYSKTKFVLNSEYRSVLYYHHKHLFPIGISSKAVIQTFKPFFINAFQ